MPDYSTTQQDDLFAPVNPEQIPLPDGNLTLWRQLDLGIHPADLRNRLISEINWEQQQIKIFGKTHLQPRLGAWYGDSGYRYSGLQLDATPLPALLVDMKNCVERVCGYSFNSVLLNYYRDQNDCMGMHSDDEPELGSQPVIASLSLGETRHLTLRHKTRKDLKSIRLPLTDSSLLLMNGDTQKNWRHGINRQKSVCGARINLTFRQIVS